MQIPCNLSLAGTCALPYRHGTSAWQAKAGGVGRGSGGAAPELANFAVSTVASRRTARGAREPSPLVPAGRRRHCRRLCRATSAKTLNSALFFHTAWVTFSTAELCRRNCRRHRRRHCRGTKSNYMLLNVDPLQKNLQCRDKA